MAIIKTSYFGIFCGIQFLMYFFKSKILWHILVKHDFHCQPSKHTIFAILLGNAVYYIYYNFVLGRTTTTTLKSLKIWNNKYKLKNLESQKVIQFKHMIKRKRINLLFWMYTLQIQPQKPEVKKVMQFEHKMKKKLSIHIHAKFKKHFFRT